MIPQSFIQDLLSRVDILDVVGQHLQLKKGGANYFARCPFHGEKSASFSVSPSKQFYHCFGCGAHGNAIGFLMEYSGLSFVDAVKDLAQQAGLTVPEQHGNDNHQPPRAVQEDLTDLMAQAAQFYREQLKQHAHAIAYLKKRGLSGEIVARFGIGYAPDDWHALRQVFPSRYDTATLAEVGLVIDHESGRRYDRFRDRIMFPIQDRRGRTIGFGGRILDKGEPKYLNSPETPLFEKGRELYGLVQAQKAIRELDFALVVEGYMDVVALAQFGVDNAVATLGTATTPHHLQTLMRMTSRIVFCFDGDNAGRKAAQRALETSLEVLRDDITLAFLFLPAEHDPDSFVRAQGAEAFREAAAQATPLTRFLLEVLQQDCDLETAEGRAKFVHEARPLILRIAAPLLRLQMLKSVAEAGGISQHEIEQAYGLKSITSQRNSARSNEASPSWQNTRFGKPGSAARMRIAPRARPESPAHLLLKLVLQQPEKAALIAIDLIDNEGPESAALIAIIDAMNIGDLDATTPLAALVEHFRETPHGEILSKTAAELIQEDFDSEIVETLFEDTLVKLQTAAIEREILTLTHREREQGLTRLERQQLAELLLRKHRTRPQ
jgi:DNA primase